RSDRDWSSDVCSSDLGARRGPSPVNPPVTDPAGEVRPRPFAPALFRLVLTALLFLGWLGYLGYLVFKLPRGPQKDAMVLCRPQRSEERRVGKEGGSRC